jgi:hypothetical protein
MIAAYFGFGGVSVINPIVVFYEILGRKGEVLFFCSVPDTTRVNKHSLLLTDRQKNRKESIVLILIGQKTLESRQETE